MGVAIREEAPGDAASVAEVLRAAFGRAAEAELTARLREAKRVVLSLVADLDGRISGHVLFTAVTLEPAPAGVRGVGLGPLAVLPERQHQGIGSALVEHGLRLVAERGYNLAVVLGHPGYYPRFGFVPAESRGLCSEFRAHPGAFMVAELAGNVLAGGRALVRYDPLFSGF